MLTLPMAPLVPPEQMSGDEENLARGLVHCHQQMNTLAQQLFSAAAQLRAVTNVLQARGLIGEEELSAECEAAEQQLWEVFQKRHVGVRINDDMSDKYAIPQEEIPIIDCESRYHLCHGACCALRFPLTRQDIGEGIVRWEFDQPYTIRHGPDDLCVHQDRGSCRCSIYANRPAICRTYSCRDDRRIWQDFDQRIINPDLFVVGENGERRVQFLVGRDGTPVATEGELMAPAQPVPAEAR